MKAYTDIEQSKKLAEILQPESADMCWGISDESLKWKTFPYLMPWRDYTAKEHYLPCWSLAALFEGVLPLEAEIHKQTDGHKIYYYVLSYMRRKGYLSTERHENLVDACVEMIFILKENNLI